MALVTERSQTVLVSCLHSHCLLRNGNTATNAPFPPNPLKLGDLRLIVVSMVTEHR